MTGRARVSRLLAGSAALVALLPTAAPAGPVAAAPSGPSVSGGQLVRGLPDDLTRPAPYRPHEQLVPLDAGPAWQLATGAGVTVAVLDSGVDADHPDLEGRVLPGADYVDGSTDGRRDPVGHGTTVASLVAGAGDPAVGLAPDATILPVRVLDENNRYERAATVAEGVVWAVDQGADVINLSLGGARESQALAFALTYAMAHDVVVVACTGNMNGDDYTEVWYPAREPGVVAVAGIDFVQARPERWPAALTGPETVLAAPAVVTGAEAGGPGRRTVQGTSFSSALVSGAAALIRSRWPDLPAADVVQRLVTTAEDLGSPGRNADFGYGAVDPLAALTAAVPPAPTNPLDTKARHALAGFGQAPEPPWQLAADPLRPSPGATDRGGQHAAEATRGTAAAWLPSTAMAGAAVLLGLAAAVAARHSHRRQRAGPR